MEIEEPCRRGKIIIIEGNISAGKSTLSAQVSEALGYALLLEPVGSNPYLEKYYKDPKKWALPLQLWILRSRYISYVNALKLVQTCDGVVLDRSIFSDVVFAVKNHADGNICDEGFKVYNSLRQQLLQNLPPPDCCVYLDVSPEECHRRVHHLRKRDCESGIPIEYLSGLQDCYVNWIKEMNLQCQTMKVDWSNFGDAVVLSEKIVEACSFTNSRVPKFLFNEEEISSRLLDDPSVSSSQLFVREVGVKDPTFQSQREKIIHPQTREWTPKGKSNQRGISLTPVSICDLDQF
eukprot:g1819.t1